MHYVRHVDQTTKTLKERVITISARCIEAYSATNNHVLLRKVRICTQILVGFPGFKNQSRQPVCGVCA